MGLALGLQEGRVGRAFLATMPGLPAAPAREAGPSAFPTATSRTRLPAGLSSQCRAERRRTGRALLPRLPFRPRPPLPLALLEELLEGQVQPGEHRLSLSTGVVSSKSTDHHVVTATGERGGLGRGALVRELRLDPHQPLRERAQLGPSHDLSLKLLGH